MTGSAAQTGKMTQAAMAQGRAELRAAISESAPLCWIVGAFSFFVNC